MASPFPIDSPILPNEFKGGSAIIHQVCERLDQVGRGSTSLVGGPKTGRTSLLRYMASADASAKYPSLAKSRNAYIPGDSIGSTALPSQFWVRCFRELSKVTMGQLQDLLTDPLEKAKNNTIDLYDLEDLFDAFANENSPVVLFVDDFDNLLRNNNFWPPNDFFHIVRSLGQRVPRGLSFVVATPRPLIDLWDANKGLPLFTTYLSTYRLDDLRKGKSGRL